MLQKRREIKDLEHEVKDLAKRMSALEDEVRSLEAAIEEGKRTEAGLAEDVHQAELDLLHREKDAGALRDEAGRTEARTAALAADAAARAAERGGLQSEVERSSALLRSIADGHTTAQASIETIQRELGAERDALEQARHAITDVRMARDVAPGEAGCR